MTHSNTLLVALDGTDDSATLALATRFASALGASIELFACLYDEALAARWAYETIDLKAARMVLLEERLGKLNDIARTLVDDGFSATASVAWGKSEYKGIVRRAQAINATMIVRHRQFHSAIKRAAFSNDDWNLIRTCPMPLLITRERPWKQGRPSIWAAVDPVHEHDKPASLDDDIIHTAQAISAAMDGELNVLHFVDSAAAVAAAATFAVGSAPLDADQIENAVLQRHSTAMDALSERCGLESAQVHTVPGSVRHNLAGLMIEEKADLLVLGCVARGLIKRAVLGSTAEIVLDRLACDMLVVKPEGFESPVSGESLHLLASAQP